MFSINAQVFGYQPGADLQNQANFLSCKSLLVQLNGTHKGLHIPFDAGQTVLCALSHLVISTALQPKADNLPLVCLPAPDTLQLTACGQHDAGLLQRPTISFNRTYRHMQRLRQVFLTGCRTLLDCFTQQPLNPRPTQRHTAMLLAYLLILRASVHCPDHLFLLAVDSTPDHAWPLPAPE